MGRNAKLRASRQTETTRLHKRRLRQDRFHSPVVRGTAINRDHVLKTLGFDPLKEHPDPVLSCDEFCRKARFSPRQLTKTFGRTWLELFVASMDSESAGSHDLQMLSDLAWLIGEDHLIDAWANLNAVHIMRTFPNHDWGLLRENLLSITLAERMQPALKAFGLGPKVEAKGVQVLRTIHGAAQNIANTGPQQILDGLLTHAELRQFADRWLPMCHHLENSADIAAGRVLCDAGRLVLHYRNGHDLKDQELCLSYRAPDGLLSFFPQGDQGLPIDAIRTLRRFVSNYDGPSMTGEVSPHPHCARLCRAIGLDVRNGFGFLEARK